MTRDAAVPNVVDSLTLEEKCKLVHGAVDPDGTATGYVPGVPRVGVPELRLVDGPLGVRVPGEAATAFPAPIAVAATFDPELAREQGAAMGREAAALGQDALLGPGVNLIRVPHGGRNFEYFSEDPVVTAAFAAAVVDGVQREDVVATPKHYVANSQETRRLVVSAEVGDRALRELYFPGFEAAVEAGAGSVMTAYNRINETHASDHHRLLTEILKDEWGFDGYVVSDWFGTETAVGAANAGLDLEMPGISLEAMHEAFGLDPDTVMLDEEDESIPSGDHTTPRFALELEAAVERGDVPQGRLDDMVARIVGQMARIGLLEADDEPSAADRRDGSVDRSAHEDVARAIATRGTVLLENDGTLPLSDDADVALVGAGGDEAMLGGGGSSEVTPTHEVTTLDGLRSRAEGTVTFERGVSRIETPSFFDGGDDAPDAEEPGDETDFDAAVDAAREADAAVVVVRDTTTEGADRPSLRLPGEQDALVEAVAAANDRTVVVVQCGGPVELPWRDDVAGLLVNWYPGQVDGDALASVLFGDADPGGRLPVTFAPEGRYPTSSPERFPGIDDEAQYDEGVFVGYRHFDAADDDPTYPFGFGRSYASFEYGEAALVVDESGDADHVRIDVENVGSRPGRDVVQAYVRPPNVDGVDRPVRELAGFEAVELAAGERETVSLALDELAVQRYDDDAGWTVDEGEYTVEVGRYAGDVRVELSFSR